MIGSNFGFKPKWPLPRNTMAFITHRRGGVSKAPYESFNLGDHVGDYDEHVTHNRWALGDTLKLPQTPTWLRQVHGSNVFDASTATGNPTADAVYTNKPGVVCAILTADCLPILMSSCDGLEVAAIHAGWKGLLAGVIPSTIEKFSVPKREMTAYIGPAISAAHYQVGSELRDKFIAADSEYETAFHERPGEPSGRFYLGLAKVAQIQLAQAGLDKVSSSGLCTFRQSNDFYSYRREGVCGRFASLIWRTI